MSFPRAKIQRFNEVSSCTPSPADYNPKVNNHVANAIISNTDRFAELKSPALSDNTSINSSNGVTCFRTPTLPKRKKQLLSSLAKVKSADIFGETDTANEALKEKIVECKNKDMYIKELTEQIEEMRMQMNKLHLEKDELQGEKIKFEDFLKQLQDEHMVEIDNMMTKHSKEEAFLKNQIVNTNIKLELTIKEYEELKINNLKNKYEEFIKKIKEEHKVELENLQTDRAKEQTSWEDQIKKVNIEMVIAKKDWNKLRQENRKDIEEVLKNISQFQRLNNTLIKAYNEELKVKEEIIAKETQASNNLKDQLKRLRDTHKREIEELQSKHKVEIEELQSKHKVEIEDIEYEMLKTITELQNKLEGDKQTLEKIYKTKITNMENAHQDTVKQMQEEIGFQTKEIEEQIREKCLHIENEWREKLKVQNEHSEKLLQEYKDLHEFYLTQSKVEKDHLEEERAEKIREVENTWKTKLEAQIKESDDILKECQAISEYNIIQCELEKNEVKDNLIKTLDELDNVRKLQEKYLSEKTTVETLYLQLKSTYDEVIDKLERTQKELIEERDSHKEEIQKMLIEKHTFVVTIAKTRKAVEAVTKRLFDSDRDVEQLKSELEQCEKAKLQIDDKCNKLTQELETMTKLYEDLELKSELNLEQSEIKILDMEKRLTEEVNQYKKIVNDTIADNNRKVQQKNGDLEEIKDQLHQQQILNSEAQNLISKVRLELEQYEKRNSELEKKVSSVSMELENVTKKMIETEQTNDQLRSQLQEHIVHNGKLEENLKEAKLKNDEIHVLVKQMNHLQEKSDSYLKYCEYYKSKTSEYEKEIEDLNVIQKNYIDQSGKYDELLQKYEASQIKNAELTKTVEEQESLIGPFREQLEAYELERSALISQKHDAESEAKMMGLKYAQILGHQNQKQKIKHLVDLKRRNYELIESKAEIETKMRAQMKTIEKLRKEVATLTKSPRKLGIVDKENINSPNRSLNNSYVSSPLREKNELK